ncbi:PrsW family intramembrane metalloprotease [Mycoplasmatota bacterium]|nr:PrsW family intramembrane metalloprotease [Mycoplasmatota bacterium]
MKQFIDLFMLAITPGIALSIFIYYLDKHDKEPKTLLLKLFFYGMLISIPVILFEKVLMSFNVFTKVLSELYKALIVAGFTEEFFKRFVVLSLAYKNKNFNEKFDGIVYAVITALGFATLENILYVVFGYQSYRVGFSRAVISVPGHMLFAITMGYYLSLAKFCTVKRKCQYYFVLSLVVPIIFHGLFDFIIYVQAYVILPIFIIFLIFLYFFNIKKLHTFYCEKKEVE